MEGTTNQYLFVEFAKVSTQHVKNDTQLYYTLNLNIAIRSIDLLSSTFILNHEISHLILRKNKNSNVQK